MSFLIPKVVKSGTHGTLAIKQQDLLMSWWTILDFLLIRGILSHERLYQYQDTVLIVLMCAELTEHTTSFQLENSYIQDLKSSKG